MEIASTTARSSGRQITIDNENQTTIINETFLVQKIDEISSSTALKVNFEGIVALISRQKRMFTENSFQKVSCDYEYVTVAVNFA